MVAFSACFPGHSEEVCHKPVSVKLIRLQLELLALVPAREVAPIINGHFSVAAIATRHGQQEKVCLCGVNVLWLADPFMRRPPKNKRVWFALHSALMRVEFL